MSLCVYLCGPINGCTDEESVDWREQAKKQFPKSLNPMLRDYRGIESTSYREIVELDKREVRSADVLLVNYTKPSVGTSMEIFYAWTLGIPVCVVAPRTARISPWLRYHSTTILHSFEDAYAWIKESVT